MATITIYRAADAGLAKSGACFAADLESAAEYTDNPGYGGDYLWSLTRDIDTDSVLSLVDGRRCGVPHGRQDRYAWQTLADALDLDVDDLRLSESVERAIDSRRTREALREAGYDWIVYEDSYPVGCVTWVYVGGGEIALTAVE